jgi:hypothetical protein
MSLIIGVSGRARHGKTDFCEAIAGHLNGYKWEAIAGHLNGYKWDHALYAGPARIYDIGDSIRRYCIKNGFLPEVERKDMTREQLQILIDVGKRERANNEDFWIHQVRTRITFDAPDVALIPNLRYQNEANAVREWGGYVIRMTRLNEDGSVFISDDRPANDISETNLEFWPADFYIVTKNGHAGLIAEQAITLYHYLEELDATR